MKWLPYIFTAVVFIAIGGVLSYLDYQQHGFSDISSQFHPVLPADQLLEDTRDNTAYVPPVTEPTPETPVEVPTTETPQETSVEEPVSETSAAENAVKELFTSKGISDIVVRQNLGTSQQIFDLISIDATAGTFQVYDVTVNGASLRIYLLASEDAAGVFQYIVNAARLASTNNGLQVTRLEQPYGDEFAYFNVQNDATTVRGLMRQGNQVIGLQYGRSAHGTLSQFLNAYK